MRRQMRTFIAESVYAFCLTVVLMFFALTLVAGCSADSFSMSVRTAKFHEIEDGDISNSQLQFGWQWKFGDKDTSHLDRLVNENDLEDE